MTLRIWLQEGQDGEPGVVALGLDFLGFTTWAESEPEVLASSGQVRRLLRVARAARAGGRARILRAYRDAHSGA